MSVDAVANSDSSRVAGAASSAAQRSGSGTAAPVGFAALMQGLSDSAGQNPEETQGFASSLGKSARDKSQDATSQTAGSDGSATAAGQALNQANAAVPAQPTLQPTVTARTTPTANAAPSGTGKPSSTVAASTTAALQAASLSAGTTSDASATQDLSDAPPYLRQAAFLQQLASAQGQSADGSTVPDGSTASSLASGPDPAAADSARLDMLMQADAQGFSSATATLPVETTTLALAGLSTVDAHATSRTTLTSNPTGSDGAAAAVMGASSASAATGVGANVQTVAPDPGATTEMRVAQQVTYWIGKGVSNAQMDVEGIDEKPIRVGISIQGQETHVTFQAEQAQTQQVLQNSTSQLRDMLQSQGLVLSSVTVGGSGAGSGGGGAQGSQSQDASPGRQAQVLVPEVVAAGAATTGAASGAALDLFV